MAYKLGGYYMDLSTTHSMIDTLQIDLLGCEEDLLLEHPINHWLAEHNKLDCKAGVVPAPGSRPGGKDRGMLMLTQHLWVTRRDNPPLVEGEKDLTVWAWLVKEAKVPEEKLRWVEMLDTNVLLTGSIPERIPLDLFRPRYLTNEEAYEKYFKDL